MMNKYLSSHSILFHYLLLQSLLLEGKYYGSTFKTYSKTAFSVNTVSSLEKSQRSSELPVFLGNPICTYETVAIPTTKEGPPSQAVSVEDLTPKILSLLVKSGMKNGAIDIISRHTTTALTINEREGRLAQDMEMFFLDLAPADERSDAAVVPGTRYFHNDIDKRPDSVEEAQRCRDNGWDIDDPLRLQAWRDQEPINAHSHLLSMLLGSSETIPVVDGEMVIGQWQSVLLIDLDGPRDRTVGVQFLGYQ